MNRSRLTLGLVLWLCGGEGILRAAVVFETYSAYHHIQVVDKGGIRTLSFNGSTETQMSLANALTGHFEYTEYFHTPWIWNRDLKQVLMIGLGGGSTQRAYLSYYTNTQIDTVELDPAVTNIARRYFGIAEGRRHKIHVEDGRRFLQRSSGIYDVIVMDAYTTTRFGSSLPPHLTTKEFFELARKHLGTNGVLAYNIIGQADGLQPNIVGAIYNTLKEVFPQVYVFPARTSMNVVLIATRSPEPWHYARVQETGAELVKTSAIKLPEFQVRLRSFRTDPPRSAANSPVLTDDHAAIESLIRNAVPTR
jgi:spermidine synthase